MMGKRALVLLSAWAAITSLASALPSYVTDGLMTWNREAAGSTYQDWSFDSGVNPAVPENYFNPYAGSDPTIAGPVIDFSGDDGSVPFQWSSKGIWMGDPLVALISVPNSPVNNPVKYVWFEMKYKMVDMIAPDVTVKGNYGVSKTSETDIALNDGWRLMTIGWTIRPNPSMEWFTFSLWGTGGYLDSVSIDTLCTVPEPATMLLLGAGLALAGRMRKR